MAEPQGLDSFIKGPQVPPSVALPSRVAEPAGLDEFVGDEMQQAKYGTPGQQAIAWAEGVARGISLGVSDPLEMGLGFSTQEAIRGRKEANPVTATLGSIAGGAGLIGLTGGAGAAGLAGMAAEGAAFSAGNLVSEYALGDPDMNAQKIATDLGMGAVLGVGFGLVGQKLSGVLGKSGHVKGTLSDGIVDLENQSQLESDTAKTLAKKFGLKENAPEIINAAKMIGAPVTEGMVSDNPWVQRFEDSLVNGAPTYAAIRKAKLYESGYGAVEKTISDLVGESGAGSISKAQFGQSMEQSLASNIAEESAPISELYNAIRGETANIGLSAKSLPAITKNIMDLESVRLDPDGPAGQLAKRMAKSIENIKTVDDVKSLRKILSDSLPVTASRNEKYVIGEISDRLQDLEKRTIAKHAQNLIKSHEERLASLPLEGAADEHFIWAEKLNNLKTLVARKNEADKLYQPFITKIKTLAKYFGKKNISGAQGAIDFITHDLTPEALANKVATKGNSEFNAFFNKNFEKEAQLLREYQKSVLRDAAVDERTGEFGTRKFLKSIFKLEPEQRENLFKKDELKKLEAARTYLRSIPEDFNPSHTAHEHALREFMTHPMGAIVANVRDFGIDTLIKNVVKLPPELRPDPLVAGADIAKKFNKYAAIQKIVDKTDKQLVRSSKAIFNRDTARGAVLSGAIQGLHTFKQKADRITELASSPEALGHQMSNHTQAISTVAPSISQGFQNSMVASVQFLNSKVPRPASSFMLSPSWEPSDLQKQKFEQYFDIVNNPLEVLTQIKDGTLSSESMEAINATHPELLKDMRIKVMSEMKLEKAHKLPYPVKMSLSKFLGQPLESSMLPNVVMANQSTFNPPPEAQAENNQPRSRSTQSGLEKLDVAGRSKTETQSLEGEES